MSETIERDKWVSEYLMLPVPPPPGPPKRLGNNLQNAQDLKRLAGQIQALNEKKAGLMGQQNSQGSAMQLMVELLIQAFDEAIDEVERREDQYLPGGTKKEVLEKLEADRLAYAATNPPAETYKCDYPEKLGAKITKLLLALATARHAMDEAATEEFGCSKDLQELGAGLKAFLNSPVDGIARTARALQKSIFDPRAPVSTRKLSTMIESGTETRPVAFIDEAEEEQANAALIVEQFAEATAYRRNMSETEKQEVREGYERQLQHMDKAELQGLIDSRSAISEELEDYYADDEGKLRVREWLDGLMKEARRLLPDAPPPPEEPTPEDIEKQDKEMRDVTRSNSRDQRERLARTELVEWPDLKKVKEDLTYVVEQINLLGASFRKLATERNTLIAELQEDAKQVIGEVRILVATGLDSVPEDKLQQATAELKAIEKDFASLAKGNPKDGIEPNRLTLVSQRYGLRAGGELLSLAEATVSKFRELNPNSPHYKAHQEWDTLVSDQGSLAPGLYHPLDETLHGRPTTDPMIETVRERIGYVLRGGLDMFQFSKEMIEKLPLE